MQILDERADPLVQEGQVLPQRAEIVAVMVPPAERQRHTAGTRFDEPPGNEHVFHEFGAAVVAILRIAFAVAGADLLILLFEVQRVQELAGR